MAEIYRDTPENFEEIRPYIMTDPIEAGKEIIHAKKCFFYDTCSFQTHMELPHPEYLSAYINSAEGILIIPRCILMELCAQDGKLRKSHIDYIRTLYKAGIKVLVIFEEDLFETLSMCFSDYAEVNSYLTWAVRVVKSRTGTIESTLQADDGLTRDVLAGKHPSDKKKFSRFFSKTRENKVPGDDLGEELLAVCIHMLAGMPEGNQYKYILFSEDKCTGVQIGKVIKNLKKRGWGRSVSVITTPKLAQIFWEKRIITEKKGILEILSAGNKEGSVKVFCSEKYDLLPELKTMEIRRLTEKIAEGSIHINY